MSQNIPQTLLENIKNKNIVLFLGSGFAYSALHPIDEKPPLGNQLGHLISDKFLAGDFKNSSLTHISDLAISESSLFEVQNFIYDIFEKFEPSDYHLLYSTLPWKAIFTTNYDLILEKAYIKNKKRTVQDFIKVYRNTPEPQIFKTPNTVPFYKLHGCISYINDQDLPLILSTEQYITHKDNRERLFQTFETLCLDYPILFIGYSNQDPNIRSILKGLESLKDGRPRSYMVSPSFSEAEIRYWNERKITPLSYPHQEFIQLIDNAISDTDRTFSKLKSDVDRNVYKHFTINVSDLAPSDSLTNFLDYESEYIHRNLKIGNTTAKAFYKGFLTNWDPIINNFDVRRSIEDRILTDIILEDNYQEEGKSFLFIVKGFGGAGKSVLLKRLAWESAIELEKLVLYIGTSQTLRIDPIIELYNYVKERIYIFIDDAIKNEKAIINLVKKATKDEIPITIVTADRISNLNEQTVLNNYISQDYILTYLRDKEIDQLLDKLQSHDSLGHLASKTRQEQKKEFEERSGRELLVALYEATGGKPFEAIVLDEYIGISNDEARSLYLTVSVFHRLNTKVRAGLISRIHNIGFHEFSTRIFLPLEFIVFSEKDYFINDFVYSTRHPFIAQMVFEQVLSTEQQRYDEYIKILSNINIDYNSDRYAFLDITNARKLIEIFNDPIKINNIYDLAEKISPKDPKLIQQRGIFEMISNSGNLYKSQRYLKLANSLAPEDAVISHSLAEVSLKKAESSLNVIERNKFLDEGEELCRKIIKKDKDHGYSYHTLLKIYFIKFKLGISLESEVSIEMRIKDFEKILAEAKQILPDHEFILEIEAKFNEELDNEPKAIELLKTAFNQNRASPFLAIRYSKLLERNGEDVEAIKALSQTLELNPNDRDVNYNLATLKRKIDSKNYESYLYLFRRSFTKGDTRYDAQFWYAVSLYEKGDFSAAKVLFNELALARVPPVIKNKERGVIESDKGIQLFDGTVTKQEGTYAFIRRERFGDDIFMFRSNELNWQDYIVGSKVEFNLAFNYKGPLALNVRKI